tara:strand:- start:311 stop:469 length:159 start_codon:yes stop_codon:yes gene_type:complete
MMLHIIVENFTDNPTKDTAKKVLEHLKQYPHVVNQVSEFNRKWVASVLAVKS